MTDATQSDATQADADAQSQADTTSHTDNTSQADAKDATAETISLDEAKKLRSESASLRKRLKDAEAAVQKFESANQTEAERRDADLKAALDRAAAAEEKAQRTSGQAAIFKAAADSISPEAVYALAERHLEFNDDAEPTNVDDVLAEIKKSNPKLFPTARGAADGGKTGRTNGYEPQPGTDRIRHAYEEKDQAAKR